ncbi:L,D-transpeptidase family protein [Streptacidiphilus anmyonensis]|uniref:L,D-transpeptidase family protein n=1 Tax=Streptacidiphilus anmyonensis TaxID=405782 RepID=UPI0005A9B83C|nr:L,D-transpeptidase family protein [Streptacidiphilus anmyonensis]
MNKAICIPAAALVASLLLTGCARGTDATVQRPGVVAEAGSFSSATASPSATASHAAPGQLPGLGRRTRDEIPATAGQVVLVSGRGRNSPDSTVTLYTRTASGWQAGRHWPAHNALDGWTDHHLAGDLRSPIGVYTLTDAGGLLDNPGTRMPYDHSGDFTVVGTGFEGEPLAGSFDYVIAIDYNRVPGTSPLDGARPLGSSRGGGIWIHVDHGGPTHGCVGLAESAIKTLLMSLDPARHPVVVMGDAASLAQ